MSTTAGSIRRIPLARGPLRLLSDDRLARLVAAGDEHAFAALYGRHHQAIFRYCLTIVRHEEDARDALQSTMANALGALGRGLPDAPLRPWLFRIAHNEAVSVLRRRRPESELDEERLVAGLGLEAEVENRRRLAMLVADLQDLPERQRGALVMRELSGLSHEEIGAALELPAAKAKQAILDARLSLREFDKGRAMRCAEVQGLISAHDGRQLRGRPIRAHLRECAGCRELRDAIGARRSDFALLAPPLPPILAAGLLAKLFGGGAGSTGTGTGAVVVGKAATATLMGKTIAGAAVVATVGAGVGVSELRPSVRADDTPVRGGAPTPGVRPPFVPARTAAPASRAPASRTAVVGAEPGAAARRARRPKRVSRGGPAPAAASAPPRARPPASDRPAAARAGGQRRRPASNGTPAGGRVHTRPARPARPAKPTRPARPVVPAAPVKPERKSGSQAKPPVGPGAGAGRKQDPDLPDPGA